MSGALTAGAAVESLRNNPDKYRTLNELRELAKQVDIDSPGKVTVLYSGDMADRVSAWNVVKAMEVAGENVRLIDRTEINKFLNSREFISATADAHGRIGVRVDFSKKTFRKITLTPVSFPFNREKQHERA